MQMVHVLGGCLLGADGPNWAATQDAGEPLEVEKKERAGRDCLSWRPANSWGADCVK